jgi:hypothetical protein
MATKTKSTKVAKKPAVKHIGLVKNDAYLQPYEDAIRGRHDHALWKLNVLTNNGKTKLTDFANGHKYYGLHKTTRGWVFREWAPNATASEEPGATARTASQILPRSPLRYSHWSVSRIRWLAGILALAGRVSTVKAVSI